MLVINDKIKIPDAEFEITFARSSGPGGQNVNKVNSKAVLRWAMADSPSLAPEIKERFKAKFKSRLTNDDAIVIMSDRFRDQNRNVDDCLAKLSVMLIEAAAKPKPRKATKPSRAAVEKRLEAKKATSEKKARRRVDF